MLPAGPAGSRVFCAAQASVHGFLIGGASRDAGQFAAIVLAGT